MGLKDVLKDYCQTICIEQSHNNYPPEMKGDLVPATNMIRFGTGTDTLFNKFTGISSFQSRTVKAIQCACIYCMLNLYKQSLSTVWYGSLWSFNYKKC